VSEPDETIAERADEARQEAVARPDVPPASVGLPEQVEAAEAPDASAAGGLDEEAGDGAGAGGDGTDEDDELTDGLGAPTLAAALEALLLVTDEPLDVPTLATLVRRTTAEVDQTLRAVAAEYDEDGRGFELREVAGGWRFYTRADCSEIVERFVRDGQQARLTQAALETLAVVAYKQPVSRARISAVRGVNVDGVIRTLTSRGLVAEAGHDPTSQAILYRTTDLFLERLGVSDLGELPPLADYLPDIELLDALADEM
jgi:segregation and condensation protein B